MDEICVQIAAKPPKTLMRPYKPEGPASIIYHGYGPNFEAAKADAEARVRKAKATPVGKPIAITPVAVQPMCGWRKKDDVAAR